jgi:hypothetical protein
MAKSDPTNTWLSGDAQGETYVATADVIIVERRRTTKLLLDLFRYHFGDRQQGRHILDLGCGDGIITEQMDTLPAGQRLLSARWLRSNAGQGQAEVARRDYPFHPADFRGLPGPRAGGCDIRRHFLQQRHPSPGFLRQGPDVRQSVP